MSGIGRIAKERQRQIEQEGWTPEHDDQHRNRELCAAANCYVFAAQHPYSGDVGRTPGAWPFGDDWWKPSTDRIRNLEKAGALIAAEIDRLERLKEREAKEKS